MRLMQAHGLRRVAEGRAGAVQGVGSGRCLRAALAVVAALATTSLAGLASGASVAHAEIECAGCKPWLHVVSSVRPANLPPGGEGVLSVQTVNIGDATTTGPVQVTDELPPGLKIVKNEEGVPQVSLFTAALGVGTDLGPAGFPFGLIFPNLCSVTETTVSTVSCALNAEVEKEEFFGAAAKGLQFLTPYSNLELQIKVEADPGASSHENTASASGGGAAAVTEKRLVHVESAPTAFGVEDFSIVPEDEGGTIDSQAGSHPFQLTTTFSLNQGVDPVKPPAFPRNLQFKLPPGMLANVTAVPQCSEQDFYHLIGPGQANTCPPDTVIGVSSITIDEPDTTKLLTVPVPLFNLAPGAGEPARFGFEYAKAPVVLDTAVRTGEDYGVTVSVSNITQVANFLSTTVTFWGVPGDSRHDAARGWGCLLEGLLANRAIPCVSTSPNHPPPFLTLPTACAAPFAASVTGESWPIKASPSGETAVASFKAVPYSLTDEFQRPVSLTGCNQLQFDPSIEVAPDVQSASTSTGLTVHVRVPQEVNQNGAGLASSNVRNITVALPEGLALNPAGAGGLEGCSNGRIGFKRSEELNPGGEPGVGTLLFSATLPEPLSPGLNLAALGFCTNASKVGTVKITSPLIPNPVVGSVYLASQNENPFGSLVAMYIVAEDPVSGTLVKLPGKLSLSATGQILASFDNNPQLPFEDAELHFFGGERAPLSTPAFCREDTPEHPGHYTTNAIFSPWSGSPPVGSSSSFQIITGPNGGPCPGASLPFSPALTGGTTNINAGSFSPLTTTIGRADGQQDMSSVTLHMPPGLTGILTGVKLCPEAQANAGTCGPESAIGETTVSAGVGSQPVSVKGGKVYLTEKYAGAPFGLSIVNPVKTGPFDLEHDTANPNQQPACDCVVVRAKIEVDPTTAALTITTDPSGPHAIPTLIDGIPVQIQKVNVLVNREHFTLNPTSCNAMSLTGTIASAEGAASPVSVPFQVTNCANLKFTPSIAVTTAAKTTKANGSSLVFKIAYPKGAVGSQSWFNEAKFDLPKQLPARLTTIQKACLASVFDANPAACPPASLIGHAIVHTPVLPVPLTGPVYFVSHGGAKFPDAVILLNGYGITARLVGETFISGKTGITSATFKSLPDEPFESIEVTLPTGRFSEFGSNLPASAKGSFCGQNLIMPTFFKGQNGLEIHKNTKVGVTGCRKTKTRAELYAAALKACHKKHNKTKRAACQRAARKKYGPQKRT
jgi:hypothetical protein